MLSKYFKTINEIKRFIVIGVLNTLFGYSMYAFFVFSGFNYVISVFFATTLGVLFNFKTISKFVFRVNNNLLIYKFILVYVIVFIFNVLFIYLSKRLGLSDYTAGLIAIAPVAAMSFFLNKFYVYRSCL